MMSALQVSKASMKFLGCDAEPDEQLVFRSVSVDPSRKMAQSPSYRHRIDESGSLSPARPMEWSH